MTKREFLSDLRNALTGELPENEVENNIRFYDDYIRNENSNTEEEILAKLGDPRLIAKTIIDTYQIAHGPLYNNVKNDKAYQDAHTRDDKNFENSNTTGYKDNNNTTKNRGSNFGFQVNTTFTWYQKLIFYIILIILIAIVVIVGGALIQLFFTIGMPLLVIYIIYKLIAGNRG